MSRDVNEHKPNEEASPEGFGSNLPSRTEYHRKKENRKDKKPKKRKIKWSIPLVLLLVLLMLPLAIIFLINTTGSSKAVNTASGSGEEVSFETDIETEPHETTVSKEESREEADTEEKGEKTKADQKKEEPKKVETPTEKTPKSEEKQPVVKEKPKDNKADAEPPNKKEDGKAVYHTVQPGENLFRIALKYYSSQAGVDKIRQANGLSGNEISVGQTLKIPQP